MRVEDFLCCDLRQGPGSVSFVLSFSVVYIPLRGQKTINETKSINQSVVRGLPLLALSVSGFYQSRITKTPMRS
jgi:hypothetical protein